MASKQPSEYLLPLNLVRLHVILDCSSENKEQIQILRKLGNVRRGSTVTRDIIVPGNMPLRALHFTLQRSLGFRDSGYYYFGIDDENLVGVTDNRMENLLNLRGIIFKLSGSDDYMPPEFQGGSFKKWMQKQYTAPFDYNDDGNSLADYHDPQSQTRDFEWNRKSKTQPDDVYCQLTELHPGADLRPDAAVGPMLYGNIFPKNAMNALGGKGDCFKWKINAENRTPLKHCSAADPGAMACREIRLGEMNITSGLRAIKIDQFEIAEHLKIRDVLALSADGLPYDDYGRRTGMVTLLEHPQVVTRGEIQTAMEEGKSITPKPFTDRLRYICNDYWKFTITGSRGCSDLLKGRVITMEDLDRAVEKAQKEQRPVLIAQDGDMLVEECANIEEFCSLLDFLALDPHTVIKERGDFIDPFEYGFGDDLDEEELEEDEEEFNEFWKHDILRMVDDSDERVDHFGRKRSEALVQIIYYGWHRNDVSNIDLL